MEKMEFNHFPHYKSMEAFCCHDNQTMRQITITLAIFKSPYPGKMLTLLGANLFKGFAEEVIWKVEWTDD